MTQLELLQLHVRALYMLDEKGLMMAVNEPWSDASPAPLLHMGKTRDGAAVLYLRRGTDAETTRRALKLAEKGDFDPKHYADLLSAHKITEEWCYSAVDF